MATERERLEEDIKEQEQLISELENDLYDLEDGTDEWDELYIELSQAESYLWYLEACRSDYE